MKKVLVCILFLLILQCAFPAFAQEKTVYTSSTPIGANGSILLMDGIGMQMFVPDSFSSFALNESEIASGMIAYLMTKDSERAIMVRQISSVPENLSDERQVLVNGMEGVLTTDPSTDAVCLYLPSGNTFVQFAFVPASDTNFAEQIEWMIGSIQKR